MLAELARDLPIKLDLIDVNDPTGRLKPPSAEELRRFRDALTAKLGVPVGASLQRRRRHRRRLRNVGRRRPPHLTTVTPSTLYTVYLLVGLRHGLQHPFVRQGGRIPPAERNR